MSLAFILLCSVCKDIEYENLLVYISCSSFMYQTFVGSLLTITVDLLLPVVH